ncbi:hypothetical protein ACJZ2D_004651 [Fusarium nematophilum]
MGAPTTLLVREPGRQHHPEHVPIPKDFITQHQFIFNASIAAFGHTHAVVIHHNLDLGESEHVEYLNTLSTVSADLPPLLCPASAGKPLSGGRLVTRMEVRRVLGVQLRAQATERC